MNNKGALLESDESKNKTLKDFNYVEEIIN